NEEILDILEIPWDSYEPLTDGWMNFLPPQVLDSAIGLIEKNFGDVPAFALKDPRVCRLWPFWLRALERSNVRTLAAHVLRAPAEVIASLAYRDSLSSDRCAALWVRYVLDAERISVPRFLVKYDDLLTKGSH